MSSPKQADNAWVLRASADEDSSSTKFRRNFMIYKKLNSGFLSFNRKNSIKTRSLTMCQHWSFGRWHNFLKDIDQLRCCTITNSMSFYTKTMFFQMAHSLAIWFQWNRWSCEDWNLRDFCDNPMLPLNTTVAGEIFSFLLGFMYLSTVVFVWTQSEPCWLSLQRKRKQAVPSTIPNHLDSK